MYKLKYNHFTNDVIVNDEFKVIGGFINKNNKIILTTA